MREDFETIAAEIRKLFALGGDSNYGGESVNQREHALQAAWFAERAQAKPDLVLAALLHDVGHLLHQLPEDAPDHGIDDRHEDLGGNWLRRRFAESVTAPVQLHVAAKRYLCAVDPNYFHELSPPSIQSLQLQGGPMSSQEVAQFERHPEFESAVALRRWDDAAKIPNLKTPDIEHYLALVPLSSAC